jgi:hypothetical protein
MSNPCVPRATLRESNALCNKYTVDAIKPAGFDSCLISERDILALLEYTARLRPFGRELDCALTAEVAAEAMRAAGRPSSDQLRECDLSRLKRLAWPVACRLQARELKVRSAFGTHKDLEIVPDRHGETPFQLIETECALEAATLNLIEAGIAVDGVVTVVLHFLGWSPAQIAERLGQKVEAVRKRIYRLKGRVQNELRWQFSMEVA